MGIDIFRYKQYDLVKRMNLVRPLLYKEKSFDDFEDTTENPYFSYFYKILLTIDGTKVTDLDVEKNITELFNDSCYICTLALILKHPELNLGYFRKISEGPCYTSDELRADVVLCMVYFLLKKHSITNDRIQILLSSINTDLRERSKESNEIFECFFYSCDSVDTLIIPWYFETRDITQEVLNDLNINWRNVTNGYNKKELTELVCLWKYPSERNLIIDNISEQVKNEFFEDDLPF